MRVLLTGATGFVGRALSRRLIADGHRLVILSRSPERAKKAFGFECEAHAWEPDRELAPGAAFDGGVDAVIHLAGESVGEGRWSGARKQRIRDSRVIGTRNLVQAVNHAFAEGGEGRPGAFIMASAVGYYGDRGDEVLTEDSPPGSGFLSELCQEWEAESDVLDGPRCVVLRFGMVLGPNGGALKKMLPLFRKGLGGRLGSGDQWMSWVHIDDVSGLFEFVLKHPTLEGVLNAVSPMPVTNADFTRALGRALGKPTPFAVPRLALKLGLGEMADEMLLASQRVLPVKAKATGYRFRYERLGEALAVSLK